MLISYPALFFYDNTDKVPFFITFPDLPNSATQGNNVTDAIAQAKILHDSKITTK